MQLTKDQKVSLQQLKKHEWYNVLKTIEDEAKRELWEFLLTSDLTDPKHIEMITKNQLYIKARTEKNNIAIPDLIRCHLSTSRWSKNDISKSLLLI